MQAPEIRRYGFSFLAELDSYVILLSSDINFGQFTIACNEPCSLSKVSVTFHILLPRLLHLLKGNALRYKSQPGRRDYQTVDTVDPTCVVPKKFP